MYLLLVRRSLCENFINQFRQSPTKYVRNVEHEFPGLKNPFIYYSKSQVEDSDIDVKSEYTFIIPSPPFLDY